MLSDKRLARNSSFCRMRGCAPSAGSHCSRLEKWMSSSGRWLPSIARVRSSSEPRSCPTPARKPAGQPVLTRGAPEAYRVVRIPTKREDIG